MKKRRILSCLTAAVMAVASLPVLSVSADEAAYVLGDVDMDGVVTGHDCVMVSRYVFEGDITLTEKQQALADINGDGVIDAADTKAIHANEAYPLGWIFSSQFTNKEKAHGMYQITAFNALVLSSSLHAGYQKNFVSYDGADAIDENADMEAFTRSDGVLNISQVQYHLLDANGDGNVDMDDSLSFIWTHSWCSVGLAPYRDSDNGNYMLYMTINF